MATEKRKSWNLGLWVPQGILKMPMLTGDEKLFYAYVFSFGERGCWQTDEQIGRHFGRCERSIQRYQVSCKKAGLFTVTGEGSKHRRIWAKDHPKFKAAQRMKAEQLRQTCPSRATDLSELPRQTCPATIKGTNTTTNKDRGGSPSPAEQAHAPLKDKQEQLEAHRTKEESAASIEQLKRGFGLGARRRTPELTAAEREQRVQQQKRALLAAGAGEKAKEC